MLVAIDAMNRSRVIIANRLSDWNIGLVSAASHLNGHYGNRTYRIPMYFRDQFQLTFKFVLVASRILEYQVVSRPPLNALLFDARRSMLLDD